MKLKQLGFRKQHPYKKRQKEALILKDENLPTQYNQCPPWLKAFHDAEDITTQAFRSKVDSMFTVCG